MPSVAILGSRGYPSHYGGFETAVRHLAPYLSSQGWDVTVYSRDIGPDIITELGNQVRVQHTPGIDSKSLSTLSYGLTSSLHASLKRYDVALVLNVANGFFLPFLRLARVPTLVNVDGIEWERQKWGASARRVFMAGARMTARWADQLVFDAEGIKTYWLKKFNKSGTFIPYGGEDVGKLPLQPGLKHRGYVLYVARFVPENTILSFLEAAKTISKEFPVVIVGSSGYGDEIEEKVRLVCDEHVGISWLGHLSDDDRLHSLWQHAGVYFHGHTVGGTNPALVQAMHCGAPIVARDTIYNREVLETSALFTGESPNEIYTSVTKLMKNSSQQSHFSDNNLSRASAIYSWDGVCSAYEGALRALVKKSK